VTRFLKASPRLPVGDLSRTVAFYRDRLGFEAGDLWPADDPAFVLMSRDAVVLQFYRPTPPEPCGHATISIDVEDALALHARLRDRVVIDWGPEVYGYGRREFAFRDPDGYTVLISEETDEAPTCEG
jgi:catechol 2,3-dioxygenase-like lactoylglutathione lyase family enzyme